jgi:small subunit ribosomal protein S16
VTTPVAVKIRLKRLGKIRAPYYRVVVADSRTKRDGRAIEEVGKYHPTEEPSLIDINSERVQYWLGVGAQPTEQVLALLKITGDWQKFKGLPGAEGTLKHAEPKPDRNALFDAAAKQASLEPKEGATTAKKKASKKAEPKAEDKADEKADDKAEAKAVDKAAEPEAPTVAEPAEDDKPQAGETAGETAAADEAKA